MKRLSKFRKLSSVLLAFFFIYCLASCSKHSSNSSTEKEFKNEDALEVQTIEGDKYIAIAVPLTGPYRELGNTIVEGVSLAVEEYNSKQKNPHKTIGTIIIDDGGLVSEGLARADLVIAEQALGVIGHLNSEITIETSTKYSKNKIPIISPASTNPLLTERKESKGYVFRTIGTDRQLAKAAYKYISSNSSIKQIAILFNDRVYGKSVAEEFSKKVNKNDQIKILVSQSIPVRTSNHSKTAELVTKLKPDLVFFIGEYNDAGYLVKELHKIDPTLKFLAAEGAHHQQFIKIAGPLAEGALIIGPEPVSIELSNKYQTRFKKEPSGYVGSSYDAAKILIEAIDKSSFNGTNSQEVANVVSKNKVFNPNGDLLKPDFVIYEVKNSKFVPI